MGSNSDEGTTFMNGESPFVLKTLNLLLQMLDFVSNKCWIFEQMLDFAADVRSGPLMEIWYRFVFKLMDFVLE